MALVVDPDNFQPLLRILNTNVDGRQRVAYALARIKGIGRRFANIICKKAEVDLKKRAGELTDEEIDHVKAVIQNPLQFNIPEWFLNRQKDRKEGNDQQCVANGLDNKLREDWDRMKKIRLHRGLRHYWNLRVRGQHTKTTGRRGKTVGVSGKK